MKTFSLEQNYFFIHSNDKNMLLLAFQNSTLCLHVSKPKWEGDLLLILRVINFRASLHIDFVELEEMEVNIQRVEHYLRRIEQIYSRLYIHNEDIPACNTGSRNYVNMKVIST